MQIKDNVYGVEEINEPVLVELINSGPIQRLKSISQYGLPNEYYHKEGFSRYAHSVGVLLLLRRLGADLKEQIAGLLHDVSHTAFSHVVDWLFDNLEESYQDDVHLEFIEQTALPDILKKYHFDYREFSELDNFPLLEKPAPSLCADRIDYTLRELKQDGKNEIVNKILFDLKSIGKQIVFSTNKSAELFAKEYMGLQKGHWAGNQAKARYHVLSNILKNAMSKKIISKDDLNKTDDYIIELLKNSKDGEVLKQLNLLKNLKVIETDSEEGVVLKKKFRHIDPEIENKGNIFRLSEASPNYRNLLDKEMRVSSEEVKVIIFNE